METDTDGAATRTSSPWPARTGVNRTELDPTSFLHRSASLHPDRVAVVHGELRRTYAELAARCNRLASSLRRNGLERHERVAALCPNVPELLELHHAVPQAGGVLVAINTRLSSAEIAYILEHSEAQLLFVDEELASLVADVPDGVEVVRLGEAYERLVDGGDPAGVPSWLRDEEEPIAIDYTSGTTGRPKGVVYTYRGAYLNALGQLRVRPPQLAVDDGDAVGVQRRAASQEAGRVELGAADPGTGRPGRGHVRGGTVGLGLHDATIRPARCERRARGVVSSR